MKKLTLLLLLFLILLSCNKKKHNKNHYKLKQKTNTELKTVTTKKKIDTINNYWALILDTITSKKEFTISNLKHTFITRTYSLNDSSIVRNLTQEGKQIYLDHSHTIVTDFNLSNDSILDTQQISRTHFKNSLDLQFYKECNLYSTKIDSISNNTIHLTSDLAIPDTDNQWRVWYSIKINRNRLEKLQVQKTDYVEL